MREITRDEFRDAVLLGISAAQGEYTKVFTETEVIALIKHSKEADHTVIGAFQISVEGEPYSCPLRSLGLTGGGWTHTCDSWAKHEAVWAFISTHDRLLGHEQGTVEVLRIV